MQLSCFFFLSINKTEQNKLRNTESESEHHFCIYPVKHQVKQEEAAQQFQHIPMLQIIPSTINQTTQNQTHL